MQGGRSRLGETPGRVFLGKRGVPESRLSAMQTGFRAAAGSLALLAVLAGCATGDRSRPPLRLGRTVVAVYTDIDGVSFSTDGSNYARFTDFLEREENVPLTPAQLSNLVDALEREGFFREKSRELSRKGGSVAPAVF